MVSRAPSTPGPINSSVIILSNDTTLSVSLQANVGFIPDASFDFSVLNQCDGQVNFSDLSTNSPNSWKWDFGDGNISLAQNPTHDYEKPGVYTVEMIAFNTAGSDTITKLLNMNGVLFGGFSMPDSVFRWSPVQFFDSSQVATSWQWFFGDGGSSTAQNPVHTYNSAGTYFLTLVVSNPSCTTTVNQQVVVYEGVGIGEDDLANSIRVFPNPSREFATVEWNMSVNVAHIEVADVAGNMVGKYAPTGSKQDLDVRGLASGVYLVKLVTEKGDVVVKRLIVRK